MIEYDEALQESAMLLEYRLMQADGETLLLDIVKEVIERYLDRKSNEALLILPENPKG